LSKVKRELKVVGQALCEIAAAAYDAKK